MRLKEWVPAAEIVTSLAVVITLIVLILEIRQSNEIQDRQMRADRISILNDPYLTSPGLAKVYAKVKAVDGLEPVAEAFIDRYSLTAEEAVLWSRLVQSVWLTWHSQFLFAGPSDALEKDIRNLFHYPDVQIVYRINEDSALSPQFIAYVESFVREELIDSPR